MKKNIKKRRHKQIINHHYQIIGKEKNSKIYIIVPIIISIFLLIISFQSMIYNQKSTEAAFKSYDPFFTITTSTSNGENHNEVIYGCSFDVENIGAPVSGLNISIISYFAKNNKIFVPVPDFYDHMNRTQEVTGILFSADTHNNLGNIYEILTHYNQLSSYEDHISILTLIRIIYTDVHNNQQIEYFEIMDGALVSDITENRYQFILNRSRRTDLGLILFSMFDNKRIAELLYSIDK